MHEGHRILVLLGRLLRGRTSGLQCKHSLLGTESHHDPLCLGCAEHNCPYPQAWLVLPQWENHQWPGGKSEFFNKALLHNYSSEFQLGCVLPHLSIQCIHGIDGILSLREMNKSVISDLLHPFNSTCRWTNTVNNSIKFYKTMTWFTWEFRPKNIIFFRHNIYEVNVV